MPKHESQIVRDEHDESINAKRVSLVSTSTIYAVVNTGAAGDSVANIGFATVAVSTPTLYAVVNTGAAGDSTAKIGFATVAISTPTLYAVVNGGGTQYTEGDLDSTITGTAMMFEIDTNTHELGAVNEFNPIPMYMSESIAAGDNNIGNVDIASIAAGDNNIGDVDIASIAAGVNSIGFATVAVSNIARTITGNITLSDSKGFIGLTTAVLGSAPTLYAVVNTGVAGDSTAKIGFATVNVANTVSITGTVDLGAADNAVLDNIDADLTTIIGHVDGLETLIGTTNTTLTTIDGRVDGVEGLLTTIDGDTGNIVTSVQLLDDTVATDGSATPTKGILMAGQDGTNAQTVKTDSDGNLQVDVLTMPTTTITGTVDLGATDNAVLDTIAAKDFATQTTLAAINAKLVTGTDIGDVTINNAGGAAAVNIQDGGNTITVDGTVAVTNSDITSIKTAVEILDNATYVDDADWTADTSSHNLVGAVTQVATTANTDGDTTPLTTNAFRELRVAIPESDLATAGTAHVKKYYTNAGAVTDGIVWSPAAGKRWYVTDLIVNVSAAATVTFEDDKAGGDEAVMKFELAANSGVSHTFNTPWFSGEDAADLIVTTTAGNVYITITGYEL